MNELEHACDRCGWLTDNGDGHYLDELGTGDRVCRSCYNELTHKSYCDDCGIACDPDTMYAYTHLPFDVSSANRGESGVVCTDCNEAHTLDTATSK